MSKSVISLFKVFVYISTSSGEMKANYTDKAK